jgi:DNA-3-methyladenine glycosylase I
MRRLTRENVRSVDSPANSRNMTKHLQRCPWARNPLDIKHHDEEWGVPCHDDRALFEMLVLEGAQAGLSWSTILAKRENYRHAFASFDPRAIARFTAKDVRRLLADPGIVRSRAKIDAAISNAQAFLAVQQEFGTFDRYLWAFVDGRPIVNARRSLEELPAETTLSGALSTDLIRRGFRFVGPKICYAFMQSVGLVNDHIVGCFRRSLDETRRSP